MSQARAKASGSKAAKTGLPPMEVLSLSEAATYLRVAESEILRLIREQNLPGRQLGSEWRFLKTAIQDWLKSPPPSGSREAVLSAFGAWKGDPLVEAELKETYRRRRENTVGDSE